MKRNKGNEIFENATVQCQHCARYFIRPMPHLCPIQLRKRHQKWLYIKNLIKMNENQAMQEKDFHSLIGQMNNHSETRDKQICEIDDILDRIKQNRRPSAEPKTNQPPVNNPPEVVNQFRELIRKMDHANEKLGAIISRLNELI